MLLSLLGSALVALLPAVTAISSPECSSEPYKELLQLSSYPPALSFCSAFFPLHPCTSTKTISSTVQSTVYTTSTSTVTVTTGTTVVSKISTVEDTVTVTTTDATVTQTVSTVTVVTTVTLQQRKRSPTNFRKRSSPKTTPKVTTTSSKTKPTGTGAAAVWASLESAGLSIIAEACTCIETQPPCKTVTTVVTKTVPPTTLPAVTTITQSVEATTTVSALVTESTTTTVEVTRTVSVTATTTIESDLPFYSLIKQYDPGCTINGYSTTGDTPYTSSTDSSQAISFCETKCTEDPICEAIFVQYLYPDPADVPPGSYTRWVCYYARTNSAYTGASSVNCGLPVGVYGSAYLYQNARYIPKR